MLKVIQSSIAFMTPKERKHWFALTTLRALLSLLDLAGILAIGFIIASTAIFLTSGSDPNRVLTVAGFNIPAVNANTLPWVSAGVLILFLSKALISMLLTRASALLVAHVESRASREIARLSLGSDLSTAREKSSEELVFAVQIGAPSAFSILLNQVGTIAAEGTLFLIVAAGFFLVDPLITIAAIAYFGLVSWAIQFFVGTLMNKAGERIKFATIQANSAITDLVSVFRELTVLNRREDYFSKIYKHRSEVAKNSALQYFFGGMPRYVIESALLLGLAIFVVSQALSGDLVSSAATIGVFLSGGFRLTAAMLPLQSALLAIKGLIPQAQAAQVVLAKRMDEVTKKELESKPIDQDSVPLVAAGVKVEFNRVGFKYPGNSTPTLIDINLDIEAGSQVALIGPSGAGKSTLADLMCGLLEPSSGEVRLYVARNGVLSNEKPAVSYVPQKPGLVSGTIANNVALGLASEAVDENRVSICLSRARLLDIVNALPNGIHSDLGKLKDNLSGGQAQRLGLARALYTKPELLVMDEATSALDAESESEISLALDELRGEVTVVLIAHRLNTIQHADQVFLIEQGRVSDSGRFTELILRNRTVEKLVQLIEIKKSQ